MEYGLIGGPLGHSLSPEIHRRFGRYEYELLELSPDKVGPFLERRAFRGLNVTIPYKEAVLPYLDRLDGRAAAIGAVNTVVNRDGVLWGYNTDFGGMAAALARGGIGIKGKTVCILGTGGTSKTALAVCRALGAAEVFRVSRTGREGALRYEEAYERTEPELVLINTTPVGMWPEADGCPLEPGALAGLAGVFDAVYNPLRTRLVLEARARGVPAAGGLYMLVRQAALACALFTGTPVADEQVDRIYDALRRERENLVLIGMPGAGKTTVGRILAQKTGRVFVDSDEEIEGRAGMSIAALFAAQGEAQFRALEAEVVRELAGTGGRVIATGGGAILNPENVRRLKQTGRLYFLDRPLTQLEPTDNRPLGDTAEKLRRLYLERNPIYRAAADEVIPVTGDAQGTQGTVLCVLRQA